MCCSATYRDVFISCLMRGLGEIISPSGGREAEPPPWIPFQPQKADASWLFFLRSSEKAARQQRVLLLGAFMARSASPESFLQGIIVFCHAGMAANAGFFGSPHMHGLEIALFRLVAAIQIVMAALRGAGNKRRVVHLLVMAEGTLHLLMGGVRKESMPCFAGGSVQQYGLGNVPFRSA